MDSSAEDFHYNAPMCALRRIRGTPAQPRGLQLSMLVSEPQSTSGLMGGFSWVQPVISLMKILLACTNDQRYDTLNQYVCRHEVSFLFLGQSVIMWSSHSIEHTSSCFVLITDTPYVLPYPHLHFIPLPQRYLSAPTVISKGHGPAHCHIHLVSSFMSSPLSTPAVICV